MEKTVIHHAEMPEPYGAYSTAIRVGDLLFVSGQAGIVPETGAKAGEDFDTQAVQSFENLRKVMECCGGSLDDIVKVTTWLGDAEARGRLNELFATYFPVDPPTRSTPIVDLPMGLLLSIEAVAIAR